jgi:hypothetical protein
VDTSRALLPAKLLRRRRLRHRGVALLTQLGLGAKHQLLVMVVRRGAQRQPRLYLVGVLLVLRRRRLWGSLNRGEAEMLGRLGRQTTSFSTRLSFGPVRARAGQQRVPLSVHSPPLPTAPCERCRRFAATPLPPSLAVRAPHVAPSLPAAAPRTGFEPVHIIHHPRRGVSGPVHRSTVQPHC